MNENLLEWAERSQLVVVDGPSPRHHPRYHTIIFPRSPGNLPGTTIVRLGTKLKDDPGYVPRQNEYAIGLSSLYDEVFHAWYRDQRQTGGDAQLSGLLDKQVRYPDGWITSRRLIAEEAAANTIVYFVESQEENRPILPYNQLVQNPNLRQAITPGHEDGNLAGVGGLDEPISEDLYNWLLDRWNADNW